MSDLRVQNPDWASYYQVVHELIGGGVRRNTFTRWELDLLLDLQMARLRKSSRPEALRRYLKAVQQQVAAGVPVPLRFSSFIEAEAHPRAAANSAPVIALPRAS